MTKKGENIMKKTNKKVLNTVLATTVALTAGASITTLAPHTSYAALGASEDTVYYDETNPGKGSITITPSNTESNPAYVSGYLGSYWLGYVHTSATGEKQYRIDSYGDMAGSYNVVSNGQVLRVYQSEGAEQGAFDITVNIQENDTPVVTDPEDPADNGTDVPAEDPADNGTDVPAEDPADNDTDVPAEDPADNDSEDATEAPAADNDSEDATEAPAADNGSEDATEAPAADNGSEDAKEAPAADNGAEDATEAPAADNGSEDVTEAPAADNGSEDAKEAPAADNGSEKTVVATGSNTGATTDNAKTSATTDKEYKEQVLPKTGDENTVNTNGIVGAILLALGGAFAFIKRKTLFGKSN
jgi:LPXTG-motif cell wall-anchored protein